MKVNQRKGSPKWYSRRKKRSVYIFIILLVCICVYTYQFARAFNLSLDKTRAYDVEVVVEEEEKKGPGMSAKALSNHMNVLIISQARSGSSTIGRIFHDNPDVFYLFEPFRNVPFYTPNLLQSILDCSVWKIPERSSKINWWYAKKMNNWFRDGLDPETTCRSRPLQAIKMIRFQSKEVSVDDAMSYIASFGNQLKIIHLVRHPGAVWASQQKLGWRWKRDDETWIRDICDGLAFDFQVLHNLPPSSPKVLFIQYDDLVIDTRNVVKSILKFTSTYKSEVNLDSIVHVIESQNSHLFKNSKVGAIRRSRSKSEYNMLNGWKTKLNDEQRLLLRKSCKGVCYSMGFEC